VRGMTLFAPKIPDWKKRVKIVLRKLEKNTSLQLQTFEKQ